MQDFCMVTGMVISQMPVGEYDRRISILTKEKGKITAFAQGARRPGSRFMAATSPFSFGEFKLYQGRNSYRIQDVNISNFFEELREDFEGAYYGMYFLEIADYYARENNDEKEMLKLLYQSMRALEHKGLDNRLIKAVYEIKAICVNGEYPGVPADEILTDGAVYTLNFIAESAVEKLYTFTVSDAVLAELTKVAEKYRKRFMDKPFKSLQIIETLC